MNKPNEINLDPSLEEATYANELGWSDVHPFEIIRKVSDKTIEIRRMNAEKDLTWEPVIASGGFSGHCTNQSEQRWLYSSNEDAPIMRIRLTKKGWALKGRRFYLSMKPRKFRDYNF